MKDIIIILLMCVAAIGIGAWLYFNASAFSAPMGGAHTVSYSVLESGTNAGAITDRTNYRIQNQQDLNTLWSLVYGSSGPSVPTVDFSKNEVLAVFDGQHVTNGYKVSITQIAEGNGTRTVFIEHKAPGPSCKLAQTPTTAFQIVQVAATAEPLSHRDSMITGGCP